MFLLKRGKALSRAGWRDKLDDRNEATPGPPWGRFGDVRSARIIQGIGMELGNDYPGGWFSAMPNGGWGYAYQPQTDAWAVEFVRSMPSYGTNHKAHVYIDQDWTAGENGEAIGGKNRYQVYIEFDRHQTKSTKKDPDTGEETTETKDYYQVTLGFRDTQDTSVDWFNNQPDTGAAATVDVGASVWNTAMRVRLVVYNDNLFLMYVNGTLRFGLRYNNANYNLEVGHRAANFAHKEGVAFRVRDFLTEDIPPMPTFETLVVDDNFNRANNATIGNGWTKRGTSGGISANAFSISGGTDGHTSIARNAGSWNQKMDVIFGGGSGDPNDLMSSWVTMRMNAAGTAGLAFKIQRGNIDLHRWTTGSWSGGQPTTTRVFAIPVGYLGAILVNGSRLTITMWENLLIVEVDGQIRRIQEGLAAVSSAANTWAGAVVNRGSFVNSAPFNSIKLTT